MLGNSAHYCLTQSYRAADISATQSVKFLELIWATLLGWTLFGDAPSEATLLGGTLISAATVWIAHRERRAAAAHHATGGLSGRCAAAAAAASRARALACT